MELHSVNEISVASVLENKEYFSEYLSNSLAEKKEKSISSLEKILEGEKRFETLAEMISHPVAMVRLIDGHIIHANSKLISLLNLNPSNYHNKCFFDFFVFDEDKNDLLNELIELKKINNFESELIKEDGDFFLAAISAQRTFYNKSDAVIAFVKDIEEQKMLESEKERLLEDLAISRMQIEEEAAKYVKLNVQLAESEEKLTELNASKDKFFSIIGHDLKNPLFVIQSMSEILETEYTDLTDEEKIGFIKGVREASFSAFSLLDDLLKWSRCQSGRIDYNPEPLHIRKIINGIFSLVEAQANRKNITLIYNNNPKHNVLGDKNMIEAIIRNLISNAIKFSNDGGEVKIYTKELENQIEITVADSGIGIAEKDLSKLFRIDVQNSDIGKSKEKGTGLGLILCKEFVEKHGGSIWVESQFGLGSQFKFTVPKLT